MTPALKAAWLWIALGLGAVSLPPLLYLLANRLFGLNAGALARLVTLLSRTLDRLNAVVGGIVMWAALAMVLLQVAIVLMRYVFGIGEVMAQEAMLYLHGLLFLSAAGYAYLRDAHVRVDLIYREAGERTKAWIDSAGIYLLLIPAMVALLYFGWRYVLPSWVVLEGSRERSGIQAVFVLKSFILLFVVLLWLEAVAVAGRAALFLAGRRTTRLDTPAGAR